MAAEQLEPVRRAMLEEIVAQPHAVRFVHADVQAAAADALPDGPDLCFDEVVGGFLIRQKNRRLIFQAPAGLPLQKVAQMGQRLNAGDQFNAK